MRILILLPDEMSRNLDKRVLDQIRLLKTLEHEVILKVLSNEQQFKIDYEILIMTSDSSPRKSSITAIEDYIQYLLYGYEFNLTNCNDDSRQEYLTKTPFIKQFGKRYISKFSPRLQRVVRKFYRLLNFKLFLTRLSNYFQSAKYYSIWKNNSARLIEGIGELEIDLILGVDLPGALAASYLGKIYSIENIWFDAHEYYSHQELFAEANFDYILANQVELALVQRAKYFTCVSSELTKIMVSEAERSPNRFSDTITNAARPTTSFASNATKLKSQFPGKKILLFHGGLAAFRNLEVFVKNFDNCAPIGWEFVLLGNNYDSRLKSLTDRSTRVHLLDPVPVGQLLDYIDGVDCILIPYEDLTINSRFCFPNKLGDALTLGIPVIYNVQLLGIEGYNSKYGFGIGINSLEVASTLNQALTSVCNLSPKWDLMRRDLGWTNSEKVIQNILKLSFN